MVKMAYLLLVRHGESEYNAKSLWTGWIDSPLSAKGRREAAQMADVMRDFTINRCYTSKLKRAADTLTIILKNLGKSDLPIETSAALNERDYGDLAGLNKWEVQKKYGEEQFARWRRGWDEPVPGGETLKDVYARAIPYYESAILPHLKAGENVLVSSHGNALRALIKYFDRLSDEAVEHLEMPFGEVLIYTVNPDGHITDKQDRKIDTTPPPA